ncbi:hypothetical protein SK128_025155 [Halocaridina rubra]|uniref:Uncharacterized protein n=1 Tax=Halocaridina rubra TaxID=373956 RepID=A0AAN9AF96_HALRR
MSSSVCTHAHTSTRACIHAYTHTFTNKFSCTCTHTHKQTCIHRHSQIRMQTHPHTLRGGVALRSMKHKVRDLDTLVINLEDKIWNMAREMIENETLKRGNKISGGRKYGAWEREKRNGRG